jgi:hypothetical protein
MAEHAVSSKGCFNSFHHASDRLKGDRAFMMKVVEHRPNLYWHASDELLRNDVDLLVKALAGSSSFARDYVNSEHGAEMQPICTF